MMRFSVFLLALLPATALAADTARERLQQFSDGLTAISGHFEQSVSGAAGHAGERSSGTLALRAPRSFRWHTEQPFEQLIVADGTRVWIYDPDLMQVSVRDQGGEEAHSPLTILTDLDRLDEDFVISEGGEHDGLAWLYLMPRDDEPQFSQVELGFDTTSLVRMRFQDQLGNTSTINFSDWQPNARLPADTFRFSPPPGVDVVGDAGSSEIFAVPDDVDDSGTHGQPPQDEGAHSSDDA